MSNSIDFLLVISTIQAIVEICRTKHAASHSDDFIPQLYRYADDISHGSFLSSVKFPSRLRP